MTKRYGLFLGIIVILGFLECLLTPIIALLQESASILLYPLYYLSRLLALCAPFFALGAIFAGWRQYGFRRAWFFFIPYLLIDLIVQVPISLFAYYSDQLSSFGLLMLGYALTSLATSLLLLLLALLGYFFFFFKKEEIVFHNVFFTVKSNEGRAAALCAGVAALYLITTEVIKILEDAASMLWIIDGIDLINYLFSLVFAVACGLGCYLAARAGGLLLKDE